MKYKPNFNDKRIYNKSKSALEWALENFDDEPRKMSTRLIDKHLGQVNHKLGGYLRQQILIEFDSRYNMNFGVCKSFILNRLGIDSLRSSIHCSEHSRVLSQLESSLNNKKREYVFFKCVTSQRDWQEQTRYDRNKKRYHEELAAKRFNYKTTLDEYNTRMHHGLQNMKNTYNTRDRLFKDYGFTYKYDINNCMQSVLTSYYYQITNKPLNAIESYIKHKKLWRKRLAKELEIDESIAKQIITATFTGAVVAHSKYSSINRIMGNDKAKIIFLKENKWYQLLKQDVKKMWRTIKKHYPTTRLNAKNKWMIYQKLEHKVAQHIISYLHTNNVSYFWMHDGWYADKQINTINLEQFIEQQTNLNIKLTEEINK